MKSDLDGVTQELAPVLSLAPEYRIATITGYTAQIDQRLRQRRFQGNEIAMSLREQIREFNTTALSAFTISEGE
jgi:hypothetical protein